MHGAVAALIISILLGAPGPSSFAALSALQWMQIGLNVGPHAVTLLAAMPPQQFAANGRMAIKLQPGISGQ